MSFREQERALFDLLFEEGLRQRFRQQGSNALSDYDLSEAEQADFRVIRVDALELDAAMRRDFLLSHICRAYPASFALASSLQGGLELLKALVDRETMRTPPVERAAAYGKRLRDSLSAGNDIDEREKPLIIAIVEAELGMAWTAAALKGEILSGREVEEEQDTIADDWMESPMRLADFVSASIIPVSYVQLKRAICRAEDTVLWNQLKQAPLGKNQRRSTLASEAPRLLVVRALMAQHSSCEPVVEHRTVELSDGFAPLFQHIDGTSSIDSLLQQFRQAGANDQLVEGVRSGFRQLVAYGMLQAVGPSG